MMLKAIDRRFNPRMPPHGHKSRPALPFFIGRGQVTLARQDIVNQKLVQTNPIGRTVKAPVKTAPSKGRETSPCFLNHRLGMITIASVPHDPVMQYKDTLIFQDTPAHPIQPVSRPCLLKSSGCSPQTRKTPFQR